MSSISATYMNHPEVRAIIDDLRNQRHHLHQRATIAMGSPDMVDEMKEFVQRYSATPIFGKR